MTEPPADILRRLRPIPTTAGPPRTRPRDVAGVRPDGSSCRIDVVEAAAPILLLFLAADCLGCHDLWDGTEELRRSIPEGVRVVIVAKGPEQEDAGAIRDLAPPGTPTVMSSQAYRDYRVGGPPFLVVATGDEVVTEGVAWGIEETGRATRHALEASR